MSIQEPIEYDPSVVRVAATSRAVDVVLTETPIAGPHDVQFYESDDALLDSVVRFVQAGVDAGGTTAVIATAAHLAALADRLRASGGYIAVDASAFLAGFMMNGTPDADLFADALDRLIADISGNGRPVQIFGEAVAVLWAQGNRAGALRLEELWNRAQATRAFYLFCGYPLHGSWGNDLGPAVAKVCAQHSRIIPAESYTSLADPGDQLREIAVLQQKARTLDAEITERRAASARFHFLAESMPQKIFTALPDGSVDYANRQWQHFSGLSVEQIMGWGWMQVIHPDDIAESEQRWRRSLATGEPFEIEHRICRNGGTHRWHLTRAHPMRGHDDSILLWIGSSTDIDEQKRKEADLDRSIRLRDEFLSAISHDLKTPLTVLQGQAQLLARRARRGLLTEDSLLAALEQIEQRSRMMTGLVDELLDVSQIRAGEPLHLRLQRVDLASVVRQAVGEARSAGRDGDVTVIESEPEVTGQWDALRLLRVVENLVENAIKYSPDDGPITVTVGRETAESGPVGVLTVEDHGIGIPAGDLPHIFERFYRGANAASASMGSGIGLAGVRQIVEQHGGTVAADSHEGQGSVFTVRLPAAVDEL